MHYVPTVVLSKQLNFKSAVIRSKRSSCYTIERVVDSGNLIYGLVSAFVSSYHSTEKSSVCCHSWNYDVCSLMLINDFTGVNLTNRMWFSVVCTLIDNDTHHHSGQNVVDSWNTAEWVHNKFWPLWWQSVCEISSNTVVKICFDICCIRLMDQSFGTPLSPGHPPPRTWQAFDILNCLLG